MRARSPNPFRPIGPGMGVLLALGGIFGGGPAHGQAPVPASVEAVMVQELTFGPLIPGVPERVPVTDAARRAEIVLTGEGTVELAIVLSDAMTSPGGTRIPLRFGALDGAILRNASTAPVTVNPQGTIRVTLQGADTPTRLLIGGTALPSSAQAAGTYRTRMVLMVVNAGT